MLFRSGKELREVMVYESPPELGALYTEVEEMMKVMGQRQKVLISNQLKADYAAKVRRNKRLEKLKVEVTWGIGILIVIFFITFMLLLVVQDRIEKYPQLGDGLIPKTEYQRRIEALPKKYIGR